mgnify:CR=1 FL=1
MKITIITLFKVVILSLPLLVNAQIRTSTVNVGNNNDMDITITVNDYIGKVFFEISGPSTKWFAVGFNTTGMASGYTIVSNNSNGNPSEYNLSGQSAPSSQTSQNLSNISSSTSGTTKTFEFERVTNTTNSNDYTFVTTTTTLNIVWAIGSGSSMAYHSTNRGSTSMTFTDPCTPVINDTLTDVFICNGDSTLIFNDYQSLEGMYSQTNLNSYGCDSLVEYINLFLDSTITSNETLSLCPGESVEIGGNTISSSGDYVDSLFNTTGCDSVAHIHVDINSVDTSIQITSSSIIANATDAMYNWVDCESGLTLINETDQSFTPTTNGSYALIITQNGCVDTSTCVEFNHVGLTEETNNAFSLFQNDHVIRIEFTDQYPQIEMWISNINGQLLEKLKKTNTDNCEFNTEKLASGIYLLMVKSDGKISEHKFTVK